MERLYNITSNYLDILNNLEIDEETGELLNFDKLEELDSKLEDKAEAVALYIKNEQSIAGQIKQEEASLAARRKQHENKAERLKDYLSYSLLSANKLKIETSKASLSFRKSESVEVNDIDLIPKEFIKVKTTESADKTAIKKALKSGQNIDGAVLKINQNLQIK